jgi:hypothetical protein
MVQFVGQFTDPMAQIEELLGNPVTDYPTNSASYAPANRPQDIRYEFPERGAESHGVTEDTPTIGYLPDQVAGDPRIVTDDGSTIVAQELRPPDPVAVFTVPNPLRSIRQFVTTQTVFPPNISWTGAVYLVDQATAQAISPDETRVRLTVCVTPSASNPANQVGGVLYALSHDASFSQYVVLQNGTSLTVENCKDGLFLAVIPLLVYDSSKTNTYSLAIVQEFAQPIDHNPAQV